MDFDPPEAVRPLLDRIEKFATDVVMPAEPTVMERGFGPSVALLDELRAQCKGVAEARAEIDAARLMVLHAAWTIDRKGFSLARDSVSLIKFFVADIMMRVIDRAIQLHGALGITSDTILAHYYVHERGARIYDGPDEVHKMAVSRRILARYA